MFPHYCIQNIKDGTQIRVYKINDDIVIHFSQFIFVNEEKFKKISGSSLEIEAEEK